MKKFFIGLGWAVLALVLVAVCGVVLGAGAAGALWLGFRLVETIQAAEVGTYAWCFRVTGLSLYLIMIGAGVRAAILKARTNG